MPLNRGVTKKDEEAAKLRILANRYQVVKKLGSGNFGTAFLVKDLKPPKNSEELKVLKEIPVGDLQPDETLDAAREARLLSKLSHHSVVKFYDSFLDGEFFCIVTEYCEGGDLDQRISEAKKTGQRLEEAVILQWIIQLSLGVSYLHSRRVLHRDLKARNIFLKNNMIKIGDFGISRILMGTTDMASTFTGTPYYMSPEVLQHEGYNSKSDVWSIGCLLYELCALKHAFEGQGLMGVMYKIVEGKCPVLPDSYSSQLQKVLEKILVKDPAQRPGASEILKDDFMERHLKLFKNSVAMNRPAGDTISATQGRVEAEEINDLVSQSARLGEIQGIDEGYDDEEGLTPKEKMMRRKMHAADERAKDMEEAISDTYTKNMQTVKMRKEKTLLGSETLKHGVKPFEVKSRPKFQIATERSYDVQLQRLQQNGGLYDASGTLVSANDVSLHDLQASTVPNQQSSGLGVEDDEDLVSRQHLHTIQEPNSRLLTASELNDPRARPVAYRAKLYNNQDDRPIQPMKQNIYDLQHGQMDFKDGSKALKVAPGSMLADPSMAETYYSQFQDEFEDTDSEENVQVVEEEAELEDTYGDFISQMEGVLNTTGRSGNSFMDDSTVSPFGPAALRTKIHNLRNECIAKLGESVFQRVYEYLKQRRITEGNRAGETSIMAGLKEITGRLSDCFLVDQLLFLEESPAAVLT